MLATINFYDYPFFMTRKIDNISSHWILSSEFISLYLLCS